MHNLNHKTYAHPWSVKAFIVGGLLFFLALHFFSNQDPQIRKFYPLFILFDVLFLLGLWDVMAKITISSMGLTCTPCIGKERLILWSQIASLKENLPFQRIELIDPQGKKLVHINFMLSDFDELVSIVSSKMAKVQTSQLTKFTRQKVEDILIWVGLGVGMFVIVVCIGKGDLLYGALMGLLVLIGLLEFYAHYVQEIRLEKDHLFLVLPFRTQKISFNEIERVSAGYEIGDVLHRNRVPYIQIVFKNGKKRKINGLFTGGVTGIMDGFIIWEAKNTK